MIPPPPPPLGLGWGLVFTPMVATVMAHFTRRRTLVLGVGFSSIGLSSFAFNPLFQLLVETYAWRGALLILGALSLNIVPCGALIRPRRRPEAAAKVLTRRTTWFRSTFREIAPTALTRVRK